MKCAICKEECEDGKFGHLFGYRIYCCCCVGACPIHGFCDTCKKRLKNKRNT